MCSGWKIDVHFFTYPDVDEDKVMMSLLVIFWLLCEVINNDTRRLCCCFFCTILYVSIVFICSPVLEKWREDLFVSLFSCLPSAFHSSVLWWLSVSVKFSWVVERTRSTTNELEEHSQQRPWQKMGSAGRKQRWQLLTQAHTQGGLGGYEDPPVAKNKPKWSKFWPTGAFTA